MILVTGSTGIVGTRLLFDLIKSGEKVRALKREDSDTAFVKRVFDFYDAENGAVYFEKVEWVDGDVTDIEALEQAFVGVKYCYHSAGLVSYDPRDAKKLHEINVGGTENVVNAAIEAGVLKMCHISSISAMGRAKKGSLTTEKDYWNRDDNNSVYGLSKFMAEREVWRGTAEGLPAIIVNPSIILGPSKPHQSSGMLMSLLRKGVGFYPKGTAGFVDVRDVSKACISLMNSQIENKRYILNGENLNYKTLLDTSARIFGNSKPKIKLKPWMLSLAWRGARGWAAITGSKPKVTRETASSVSRVNTFSSAKVINAISINLVPVEEALLYYRSFFD